jgi:hypothetical protein
VLVKYSEAGKLSRAGGISLKSRLNRCFKGIKVYLVIFPGETASFFLPNYAFYLESIKSQNQFNSRGASKISKPTIQFIAHRAEQGVATPCSPGYAKTFEIFDA